jgi:hypothetical protein
MKILNYENENVNLLFHINRCGLVKGVRKLGLEEVGMNKREIHKHHFLIIIDYKIKFYNIFYK